jgi:hypothetical protein
MMRLLAALFLSGGVVAAAAAAPVASLPVDAVPTSAALLTSVSNSTYHDTRLVVHIPFALHHKEGEDHEVARWGSNNIGWSGSLAEFVYYYDQPLCHHVEWNGTNFPFYPKPAANEKSIRPYILMAPPGDCSPVIWARRAQLVGAAALMIADNVCACSNANCTAQYGSVGCRSSPVLVNDGTAGDVTIPVLLISKTVGETLIKSVTTEKQPVLVEYAWGLPYTNWTDNSEDPEADKMVFYNLWTAAAHDPQLLATNVQDLQKVVKALEGKLMLEPKFRLLDGSHFHCHQYTNAATSPCDHLCTNGGRYCAVHQWNLSGHAVVKETLRRLCLWKHYDEMFYWDYWVHHAKVCNSAHMYADADCISQGLHQANVDPQIIDDCMAETGDVEADTTNVLLQSMLDEQQVSGVVKLPAIAHQETKALLDYGASATALFESVCFHYYRQAKSTNLHWDKIPEICGTCATCTNMMGCLDAGKCVGFDHHSQQDGGGGGKQPASGSGHSKQRSRRRWRFFWFVAIVGSCGYGYYYYQQQQRGMYNGGGLLSGYLQLSENDT